MLFREEQYERMGRYLDGEDIPLSDSERHSCAELLRREQELAVAMRVEVPREAMRRALRRMIAAPRRRRWAKRAASAGVGVAAALLIGAATLWWTYASTRPVNHGGPVAFWLEPVAVESPEYEEINVLTRAVEELEADVMTIGVEPSADASIERIKQLEQDIDLFWLDVWWDPFNSQL